MTKRRLLSGVLTLSFVLMAMTPESFACRRHHHRRYATGVAGVTYYGPNNAYNYGNYCNSYAGYGSSYYGNGYRPYYSSYSVYGYRPYYSYYTGYGYRPYYRTAYYSPYYGYGYHRVLSPGARAALTIGVPAAVGAGIGALAGGGRGAGIGALVGGGGGALYYLLRNRHYQY